LDSIDGLSEEYFAFLASESSGNRKSGSQELEARIGKIVGSGGYAFFALNGLRDCWRYYEGDIEVGAGEPIILIARQSSIHIGKSALSDLEPTVVWDETRIRPLGADGSLLVLPLTLPFFLRSPLRIRRGQPSVVGASGFRRATSFAWEGGVCVDSRSHSYLFPYLPADVRFESSKYSIQDAQKVSGQPMAWSTFAAALSRLKTDAQYELAYPDGNVARISIKLAPFIAERQMGFLLDTSGRASPALERLGSNDLAIVGFSCPAQRIERPADMRTVARFLGSLKLKTGRPMTDKERRIAWSKIAISRASKPVKRVIETLLSQQPRTTDAMMEEFLK
jgi:hypothetical protein